MAFSKIFSLVQTSKLRLIAMSNQIHSIVSNSAPQLRPKVLTNSVPQVQAPVPQGIRDFGGMPLKGILAFGGISFAMGGLLGLHSVSGGGEECCLWCNAPLAEDKCEVNRCEKLPYYSLREALELLMQKNRYPCGHCQRFAIGPKAMISHYKIKHPELYHTGKKCHCGAFFEDSVSRGIHRKRRDRRRCTHRPGETNAKRKVRITKERIKAHKVSIELKMRYDC